MKHSTEEYSELLDGRLPTSTLEYELCDRLIELNEQVKNCSIPYVLWRSEHVKCECGYNGQMEQNQLYDAVRCPNCQTVYANI